VNKNYKTYLPISKTTTANFVETWTQTCGTLVGRNITQRLPGYSAGRPVILYCFIFQCSYSWI